MISAIIAALALGGEPAARTSDLDRDFHPLRSVTQKANSLAGALFPEQVERQFGEVVFLASRHSVGDAGINARDAGIFGGGVERNPQSERSAIRKKDWRPQEASLRGRNEIADHFGLIFIPVRERESSQANVSGDRRSNIFRGDPRRNDEPTVPDFYVAPDVQLNVQPRTGLANGGLARDLVGLLGSGHGTLGDHVGLTRFGKRGPSLSEVPDKAYDPKDPYKGRPKGPSCSITSGVCGLPLGAKVGATLILAWFAWALQERGLIRLGLFGDVPRKRLYGLTQVLGSLGLFGLTALVWWWGSTY